MVVELDRDDEGEEAFVLLVDIDLPRANLDNVRAIFVHAAGVVKGVRLIYQVKFFRSTFRKPYDEFAANSLVRHVEEGYRLGLNDKALVASFDEFVREKDLLLPCQLDTIFLGGGKGGRGVVEGHGLAH